jgi:hypothetical protein
VYQPASASSGRSCAATLTRKKTESMSRDLKSSLALTSVLGALLLGASGCLCPPCAAGAGGGTAAPGAAPAAGSAAPADGKIWNGDGVGEAAKGWASCDKQPCVALLEPTPGTGKDGSVGLKFQADGQGFVGFGWNWFGWYPENAGIDISGFKSLTFWVRVVPASPELAPDLGGVSVSVGCSNGKKSSASIGFDKVAKDALDGKWHQVTVPVADLQKGDGKDLDMKTVWEFRIGTWSASPRKFEIYVDDIAFEK